MSSSATASPISSPTPLRTAPQPWKHLVAGGLGGMAGAIITSPFDVVKTRLQSDLYRPSHTARKGVHGVLWHFVETGQMLRNIYVNESPRALFKGLGPTLVGAIPARSINFFTYGNLKPLLASHLTSSVETPLIHLLSAACAGIVTATATNPIWVVKTRLQLSSTPHSPAPSTFSLTPSLSPSGAQCIPPSAPPPQRPPSRLLASYHLTLHILRTEGVRGMYRGLSASYLGVAEGTIQWVLYERLKRVARETGFEWAGTIGAAGCAKTVASLLTYPHEVLRTRLRQLPPPGQAPKYTGLLQTLKIVLAEEGAPALYGGLSAHLMRVVPNAAAMFFIYELITRPSAP